LHPAANIAFNGKEVVIKNKDGAGKFISARMISAVFLSKTPYKEVRQ
jgi:hypothetical protein